VRAERPCRRTAKQCYELAPSYIEHGGCPDLPCFFGPRLA
jgi:hypothetical protein